MKKPNNHFFMSEPVIEAARQLAKMFDVKTVLVATKEKGTTVKRVLEMFGPEYNIYAVGNPSSSYERGFCLHRGISDETRQELEQLGIKVILQDYSIYQTRRMQIKGKWYDIGDSNWEAQLDVVMDSVSTEGNYSALGIIKQVLLWLGEGPKVCVEIAIMAADSGIIPLDELCISIATPVDLEQPDACTVLRPAKLEDLLTGKFRIAAIRWVPKKRK